MVRRMLRSPLTTRRKQESIHGFLQFLSVAIPILKIRLGLPESLARKGQKESMGQTLPSTEGLQKDPPSMVSRVDFQQEDPSDLPSYH